MDDFAIGISPKPYEGHEPSAFTEGYMLGMQHAADLDNMTVKEAREKLFPDDNNGSFGLFMAGISLLALAQPGESLLDFLCRKFPQHRILLEEMVSAISPESGDNNHE